MNPIARGTVRASLVVLSLVAVGLAALPASAAVIPVAPGEPELVAASDLSITVEWEPVPDATSYRIYRGTSAGGQGATPIASTTDTEYVDRNLSATPTYFYQVSAVNAAGESPRSPEHASKTPPPVSTGGNLAGVSVGNSLVFYCKDARLAGFDWFQALTGWFPSVLGSSGSDSPGDRVVDMAYADEGTMTFTNVVVPTTGLYTVAWRYAFQGGLFPGVNNRQMGLMVNGAVVTRHQSFPITGSFDVYQQSALQVRLNAGVNSVSQFAVSDHGLSRVDQLIITPATASVPGEPSNLRATPANASVRLAWNAAPSGSPTSYQIFRGTKSDGEANTPVGTVSGTTLTFTDTGLQNNRTYFYFVQAYNGVGGGPLSNEVTATPSATGGVPAAPTGLTASAGSNAVGLTWTAATGATSYSVYRATTPGGQGTTPVATTATANFTDSGVTNGTTYYYTVTASNAAGTSPPSAQVSATPGPGGSGVLLSQGRPATASSVENTGRAAANAVDGSTTTRWSSAFSDPQWLQVDLGATHAISRVVLNWEAAYSTAFQLQTSPDGTTWTTIYSTTTATGGVQNLTVSGSGRYVRMNGTRRATGYGHSLWEFQVFGS